MNPEVEKLLNDMRDNKRKIDEDIAMRAKHAEELKILNEKIRNEEVHNFIQTNKAMWEAKERFDEECGTRINYTILDCPTCKKPIPSFKNIEYPKCISCIEIIKARNDLYVIRREAEKSAKKTEEAAKKAEEAAKKAEEYRIKTEEAIIVKNKNLSHHFNTIFIKNTFTDIIFGKPYSEILVLDKNSIWTHLELHSYGDSQHPCTKGMNSEWINYYSEGKVPFMTVCPVCNKATSIQYHRGGGTNDQYLKNQFTEVSCLQHYKYDSLKDEHYKWEDYPLREPMLDMYGRSIDYRLPTPSGHWVIWDPTDPDGSRAEAERRKKHNENIYKQIETLKSQLL